MPAPCMSLAGQHREWRQAGKPAVQSPCILPEEGKMKTPRRGMDVKPNQEQKQASYSPSAALSTQISNHRRNGAPADSHALKVDERLRLARERREEHLKQLASRERGWLAREERARRFYEKHLEEKRKKLEEQRQREERRRMAVEEKRRQRLKEDRDRYESVVRRTIERSQKAKQRVGHASQRALRGAKNNTKAKRRSLSQWEINLVSRLQTPTISYLARSRSAICLSRGEVVHICRRSVSCYSVSNSGPQNPQQNCATPTHTGIIRPGTISGSHQTSSKQPGSNINLKNGDQKKISHMGSAKVSSTSNPVLQDKTISKVTRMPPNQMSTSKDCLAPLTEEEDLKILYSLQLQHDQSATSSLHGDVCDGPVQQTVACARPVVPPACPQTCNELSTISAGAQIRPSAGTTDPEEASRLLAEKRRQARLQREREEEERRQRQEVERQGREELARRRAEERARQEAEALRLQEERRMMEEEERTKAEEEEAHRQKEEERKLQQQREEEEARQRLIAEQQEAERESRFQREETERQERKKRLEEIMKRTRKAEATEKKPASSSFIIKDHLPNENMKPVDSLPSEGIIKLPSPAKTSDMGLANEEDILPAVAFKERRSIRTLRGLDEIQAHQRAEVI